LSIFAHRKPILTKMTVEEKEIILLKVSGQDKPGVTAGLTSILARDYFIKSFWSG